MNLIYFFETINSLWENLLILTYTGLIFKSRFKYQKHILTLLILTLSLTFVVAKLNTVKLFSTGTLLIGVILLSVCSCVLYKGNCLQIFLITTSFLFVITFVDIAIFTIADLITENLSVHYLTTNLSMKRVLLCFAPKFCYSVFLFFIKRFKQESPLVKNPLWNILLIFLIALFLIFSLLSEQVVSSTSEDMAIFAFFVWFICMVLFAIVFSLLIKTDSFLQRSRENELYRSQSETLLNGTIIAEKVQSKRNVLQHNMQNNLKVISKLVEQQEYKQLQLFLGELNDDENSTVVCNTGNPILDAVINIKASEAAEKGIQFNFSIDYPKECPVENVDLCCILSNLIDNAIEASTDGCVTYNKLIEVIIKHLPHVLIIRIDNRIALNPLTENPLLKSTKNGSGIHGIGIKAVKASLKKYDGQLTYDYDNQVFSAKITLCI